MRDSVRIKFEKIKNYILVLLLFIWLIIPVLKEIRMIYSFVIKYEYIFILVVGSVGLLFSFIDIYKKNSERENKKICIKEMLPIIFFIGFMIWTLISSLFSYNIKNAFLGSEYRKDGYITYLAYAGFFCCAFLIRSKKMKKELIDAFIVVAILNILIVQLYNNRIFTNIFLKRTVETTCFYNSNHYGYYLLLATVSANFLFIMEEKKLTN